MCAVGTYLEGKIYLSERWATNPVDSPIENAVPHISREIGVLLEYFEGITWGQEVLVA